MPGYAAVAQLPLAAFPGAYSGIPGLVPPPTTLPPAGGGKRKKKPVRPIWDIQREKERLEAEAAARETAAPAIVAQPKPAATPPPADWTIRQLVPPDRPTAKVIELPRHRLGAKLFEDGDTVEASAQVLIRAQLNATDDADVVSARTYLDESDEELLMLLGDEPAEAPAEAPADDDDDDALTLLLD